MRRITTAAAGLWVFLAATQLSAVAQAQGLDLGAGGGGPIEVLADDGIEWQQPKKQFIARGNAQAIRGGVTVRAPVLIAHYRDTDGSATDIEVLEATGGVTITSATEQATGRRAIYTVATGMLVLYGDGAPVSLVTKTETVVAKDRIEYDTKAQKAVAYGGASVKKADKTLTAETLIAYMEEVNGKTDLRLVEGVGEVVIVTAKETARGSQGNYDAKTGIATLTGSVTINRDQNVLTGNKAVVNMNSGLSTLYGGGGDGSRARAFLVPQDKNKPAGGAAPKTP
ncbi:LptA/OstA family protein [Novispirillum itersonii]|uniref:LptA/OstA family protein n=1 Tax=Novispirillum itersonii TaxID=189 RepID=UPI000369CC0C|nr:LptA/OstA family protein [Novispirillum itersonii]